MIILNITYLNYTEKSIYQQYDSRRFELKHLLRVNVSKYRGINCDLENSNHDENMNILSDQFTAVFCLFIHF